MTTAQDHAHRVVKDTLGIDLASWQLVERDRHGNTYRVDGERYNSLETAKRWAMRRNATRSWRPTPTRWWAVMGPQGWET